MTYELNILTYHDMMNNKIHDLLLTETLVLSIIMLLEVISSGKQHMSPSLLLAITESRTITNFCCCCIRTEALLIIIYFNVGLNL